MTIYDPPSGWMCGFPQEYKPLPGESIADTLRRDGYPEKFDPDWAANHCRFWEMPETNLQVAAPISADDKKMDYIEGKVSQFISIRKEDT